MLKIGVFDSGIGGQAISNNIAKFFPEAQITTVNDSNNMPYGDKTPADIYNLTNRAIQPLLQNNSDVIVIACNTATSAAIESLRQTYPSQKFIGLEPMVKPAAKLTKSNVIGMLATPVTLSSPRYQQLIQNYASDLTIIEPDCSKWAYLIETRQIHKIPLQEVVQSMLVSGVDVIVLGCTHYLWIQAEIRKLAKGQAVILEPSSAVVKQIKNLLEAD